MANVPRTFLNLVDKKYTHTQKFLQNSDLYVVFNQFLVSIVLPYIVCFLVFDPETLHLDRSPGNPLELLYQQSNPQSLYRKEKVAQK